MTRNKLDSSQLEAIEDLIQILKDDNVLFDVPEEVLRQSMIRFAAE